MSNDRSAIDVMEEIETVVDEWEEGTIESEEALERITTITDGI